MQDKMIARGNWKSFLTLNGEELLLVKHQHKFTLIIPAFFTILLASIISTTALLLYSRFLFSIPLFIVTVLIIISATLTTISKIMVDWYFHFYVLTTRKILEVWYTPLSALVMNGILLDRVNCTEIDVQTHGLLGELIDLGDIVISFDRPTHQEQFIFKDIHGCNRLGVFLTQSLLDHQIGQVNQQILWVKGNKPAAAY